MTAILQKIKCKLTSKNVFVYLFYCLAFLYGLDFLGLDNIILPIIILLALFRQFICKRIRIQKGLLFVSLFSFSYFLFYCINYSFSITRIFYYIFFPIGLYLLGSSLATKNENIKFHNEKYIFNFIFIIAFGLLTRALLGTFLTIVNFGLFTNSRRFIDVWNFGKVYTSATGVNAFVVIMGCIFLPILLIKSDYKKWYHLLISTIGFVTFAYLSIILQNRLGLLILVISIIAFPIFMGFSDFHKYKGKIYVFICAAIIIICSFLLIYRLNENFSNFVNSIPIIQRLMNHNDASSIERIKLYEVFFSKLFDYPFGGMITSNGLVDNAGNYVNSYVHNTWCDIYAIGGIIPSISFLIITLLTIKYQLDYCIYSTDSFFKLFSFELIASVYLFFFFEPALEANIYFFVIVFIIYGYLERLVLNYKLQLIRFKQYKKIDKDNFKIVYISNFISIHQIAFHNALLKKYDDRYTFISYEEASEPHKIYNQNYKNKFKNEIRIYESKEAFEYGKKLLKEADVIIYGNAKDKILNYGRRSNKILIQCSERPFKASEYQYLRPRSILSYFKHIFPYESRYQTFCLTMSAYTAYDYELINHAVNKCFSWGYWVKNNEFETFDEIKELKSNKKIDIIFVNRLITLKHPEKIIGLAEYLKNNNFSDYSISIIGTGPMLETLQKMVENKNLSNNVTFLGTMSNENVRKIIEKSNILISTSDQNEGWGASINEGMISGCAVVASHTTGSAPVLIKNGVNGFIYDFNNDNDLYEKVLTLCTNHDLCDTIGKNAFEFMKNDYNINKAVDSLDSFIKGLTNEKMIITENGPVSKSYQHDSNYYASKISDSTFHTNESDKTKKQSEGKKFASGAIISYLAIILNIVAGLLYTPWMIKSLGQSNYGLVSLATSMITLFTIDFGLGTAVSRFIAKYKSELDVDSSNKMIGIIFKCFIALGSIIFLILFILYFFLPQIYVKLSNSEIEIFRNIYIMVGLYSIVSFTFTPLNGILMGNDKFPQYKLITLIGRIINIILVVSVLLIDANLYLYVLAIIFTGLIEIIIKWIYIKRKCAYGCHPQITYTDKKMFLSLAKFSFWAAISAFAARYIIAINPSILGITAGAVQISIFTLGSTIEGYVWQFAYGLDGMFIPKLSNMNSSNAKSEDYTDLMIKVGRIQLLFAGFIIVGFIALGRGFINDVWKLKDSNLEMSYDASYYVSIFLLLPCFVTFTQQIGDTTFIVKGKVKYSSISTLVTAAITVPLSFLLTYLFPNNAAIMAAVAVCVGKTIGMVVLSNIFYSKVLKIDLKRFFYNCHLKIFPVLIPSLLFGLLMDRIISNNNIIYFGIKVILMCIFYIIIAWKFSLNEFEKKQIKNIINPIINYIKNSSQD